MGSCGQACEPSLLPLWYVMLEPMAAVNRPIGHGSYEQDFVSEILNRIHVMKI